jgi:hypothetical protein
MHTYIILFIGIRNSIHTFIPWNCFCMAMTVTILLAPPENPAGSDSAMMLLEWLYPILVCLCMNVPPVLQLVGRCDCPTLSHSYFVPFPSGGPSYLLFPTEAAGAIPLSDNGRAVDVLLPPSPRHRQFMEGCPQQVLEFLGCTSFKVCCLSISEFSLTKYHMMLII